MDNRVLNDLMNLSHAYNNLICAVSSCETDVPDVFHFINIETLKENHQRIKTLFDKKMKNNVK